MAETLGRTLGEARRKLGMALTDAESKTFIRAKLLAALEAGEYEALPDPAYVRGYIQNYAKLLGLDPKPLLALYERETSSSTRQHLVLPEPVVRPRSHINTIPPKVAVLIALMVGLVALAVWGVTRAVLAPDPSPPLPTSTETAPSGNTTPSTEATVPAAAPELPGTAPGGADDAPLDETSEAPDSAVAVPFTLRVTIAPDNASWMRITVDGLIAYEGTLIGEDSRDWEVTEEASLRIGRPSAVSVYKNDTSVDIPSGDPPVLVLSAK
ncbi:MAG: helix-turn-helix domain-containing protein [Clostridiales bacterium]|nr:helix-turn-helix domain-containing protein [Clostridiales bacterium]